YENSALPAGIVARSNVQIGGTSTRVSPVPKTRIYIGIRQCGFDPVAVLPRSLNGQNIGSKKTSSPLRYPS
ncbi:MAG: hypothetical protein DMG61_08235, partial [Acidobacteria bacterium]